MTSYGGLTYGGGRTPGSRIPALFAPGRRVRIGLLNNMPDSALAATEQQFASLLRVAAGELEIDLKLYSLKGVRRGEDGKRYLAGRYEDAGRIPQDRLHGLIVTGAEPRTANLEDESYWPALAEVIDWAFSQKMATAWSCLAAHAAVLRLDGVRRRPLPAKLSGVFSSRPVGEDPMLTYVPTPFVTPHSRLNDLAERDLVAAGYTVLTRSAQAGVDTFVKRGPGLALFLQGHPEYDADTLVREYGRDVGRFLRGQRDVHPPTPTAYFDRVSLATLGTLAAYAKQRPDADLLESYTEVLAKAAPTRRWRTSGVRLYRNWLDHASGRLPMVLETPARDLAPAVA